MKREWKRMQKMVSERERELELEKEKEREKWEREERDRKRYNRREIYKAIFRNKKEKEKREMGKEKR